MIIADGKQITLQQLKKFAKSGQKFNKLYIEKEFIDFECPALITDLISCELNYEPKPRKNKILKGDILIKD